MSENWDGEELEQWESDWLKVEFWLVNKFKLFDHPFLDEHMVEEEYPEYVSRLLPLLWEVCIENPDEYKSRDIVDELNGIEKQAKPPLSAGKFKHLFQIITVISLLDRDEILSTTDDTRYIYTEMCTRFCEWLTTEKSVMNYFNQERIFAKENYQIEINENRVNLRRVVFDKNNYILSIENSMYKLLIDSINELNMMGSNLSHLFKLQPNETKFYKSINEWFELDSQLNSDIDLYFKKNDSDGIFSEGYKRYAEWGSRYRLMIYCSLIRKTFHQHSQLCFIFDEQIKYRLRDLIQLSEHCLESNDFNEEFNDFKVEDLIYQYQNLGNVASIFVNRSGKEIFEHCSKLEQIRSDDIGRYLDTCLERSFFSKRAVLLSSLSRDSQVRFENIVKTFKSTDFSVEKSGKLQSYGTQLKESIERFIQSIKQKPLVGVGIVTRKHDKHKQDQMALYQLLGIPTNIKSKNRRGRRTEVLFYHKNKIRSKLEAEIEYLSESLNNVIKLFSHTDCIVLAPYLNVITLAHIIQFTQCVNSLGSFENDDVILKFFGEVLNVSGLLEKWGFKFTPRHINDIAFIFCELDNMNLYQLVHRIDRSKIIRMQKRLMKLYEKNIKDSLHFPPLIPPNLSASFPDLESI